ncbi:HAMP domain-containing protein [Planktothrix sp. FACHB-1355]|uniref:histidine kinase n=1 Tax=Aerosakkonema funiforme FACHB-1375 TaxID=2949571 RepID=A0A926VCT8_9CYAN|nr:MULTISPECIES: ATP-binding protein [Oscillatoriales]MBD2181345.1 HAMP domain-containing protein [Aerosakkonema funiforme FACHB-1375]MBD3557567.1 HAMP domain-containing protein [Planktothrix sp. FACHB-1355]
MPTKKLLKAVVIKTKQFQGWRKLFFGIRTRVLVWYLILMAASGAISILAVRQVLSVRLEERGKKVLVREVKQFQQLVKECQGNNCKVSTLFDTFLSRQIPSDGEFIIGLMNGKIYKSSPAALPESLRHNQSLLKRWGQLNRREKGELVTANDTIRYLAEPVIIGGKVRGVFVVIHSMYEDLEKVNEVTAVIFFVTLILLGVTSALTWTVAGRVLVPLRLVTATARSISESDLTGRIPLQGADEIAELTVTFNEMLERLEAAFTSQRNFINDAGHELRTPITIIRGHLELLGDDPEEQRETIDLVMDELDRMNRLVNDLLLLAKAERTDFLSLETLEVATLTEELFVKALALGDRNWQLESKASGEILADRQRLTQAIMNLAQNAVQHTKENDAIALGSSFKNGDICFWVRDTGEGIAASDRDRIFERFARVANSRRRSEGYGLGLAIVKAIADAHGGKVELESQLGKGSIFTLIIPIKTYLC